MVSTLEKEISLKSSWNQEVDDWGVLPSVHPLTKFIPRSQKWKKTESIKESLYTIASRHILPLDKSNFQTFLDDLKLREKFEKLANDWYEETCGFSSITKKITNFNYLKIIALGQAVVPLILHSLAQRPDHWFVALKALTDQDPIKPGDNFEQAVEAWLNWGKKEGLI